MRSVKIEKWVGLSVFVVFCLPLTAARAEGPGAPAQAAEPDVAAEAAPSAQPAAQAAEPGAEAQEPEGPPLPWKLGPAELPLGHDVQLKLPTGYQFLGQPEAGEVMTKMGNLYNENLLGVVVSQSQEDEYFVTMRYDEEGYIKDDEELDAEEILGSIREGEEEYNAERKKAGFDAIHVDGWKEAPHYDKAHHHVIWGLLVSDKEGSSVNYSTRVLGRKGFVSVNLVTDPAHLDHDKPAAAMILGATSFTGGARYDDFDSSKDKVAEYGLTGLVLGGAGLGLAKLAKIGILAKFSKVILAALIAGKKAILALGVAAYALLKKLFGKKNAEPQA